MCVCVFLAEYYLKLLFFCHVRFVVELFRCVALFVPVGVVSLGLAFVACLCCPSLCLFDCLTVSLSTSTSKGVGAIFLSTRVF